MIPPILKINLILTKSRIDSYYYYIKNLIYQFQFKAPQKNFNNNKQIHATKMKHLCFIQIINHKNNTHAINILSFQN